MRILALFTLLYLNGCNEELKATEDPSNTDIDTDTDTDTNTDTDTDMDTDTDTDTDTNTDTDTETGTLIDASTYETVMDAIATASSGDTVYIPSGIYLIDTSFVLKTGVNLLGDEQDRPVLRTSDGDALKITQNKLQDVTVAHIHFENIHFVLSEQSSFYTNITNVTFHHCLFEKGTLDQGDWDGSYISVVRTQDVVIEYCEFLRDNEDEGGRGIGISKGHSTIIRNSYFGTTRDLTEAHEHGYFKTAINVNGHEIRSNEVFRSEDVRLHGNTLRRHDDPNLGTEYQDHMIYSWGYNGLTLTENKGDGWSTQADGGLKLRNGDKVIAYRNRIRDSGFLTYSYESGSGTYPMHFVDAVLMGNRIDMNESTTVCSTNYCGILYWRNFGDACAEEIHEDNISLMDNDFVDGGGLKISRADLDGFCASGNYGNNPNLLSSTCNTMDTSECQPDSWTYDATGVYAGDFNGDGKEDFALWQDNSWQLHESDGHGFNVSSWGDDLYPSYETLRYGVHVADVNGDNYDDLVYRGKCGSGTPCFRVHLSDGASFGAGQNWGTTTHFSENADTFKYAIKVGDFNGDGNEDLVYRGTESNVAQWIVQRSTGTGFVAEVWSDSFWESDQTRGFGFVIGNFDGDTTGRDDLAYRGECNGAPCFVVQTSTGMAFSDATSWGENYYGAGYSEHLSLFVGDYNNDNKDDLGYRGKCGSGDHKWRYHKSSGLSFSVNDCSYYNKFDEFNDPE